MDIFASLFTHKCQHSYTLEYLLPLGPFGLKVSNYPWKYHASYVFHSPALFYLVLSRFLAEHVIGQFRLLILAASCWIEAPWLPQFS